MTLKQYLKIFKLFFTMMYITNHNKVYYSYMTKRIINFYTKYQQRNTSYLILINKSRVHVKLSKFLNTIDSFISAVNLSVCAICF